MNKQIRNDYQNKKKLKKVRNQWVTVSILVALLGSGFSPIASNGYAESQANPYEGFEKIIEPAINIPIIVESRDRVMKTIEPSVNIPIIVESKKARSSNATSLSQVKEKAIQEIGKLQAIATNKEIISQTQPETKHSEDQITNTPMSQIDATKKTNTDSEESSLVIIESYSNITDSVATTIDETPDTIVEKPVETINEDSSLTETSKDNSTNKTLDETNEEIHHSSENLSESTSTTSESSATVVGPEESSEIPTSTSEELVTTEESQESTMTTGSQDETQTPSESESTSTTVLEVSTPSTETSDHLVIPEVTITTQVTDTNDTIDKTLPTDTSDPNETIETIETTVTTDIEDSGDTTTQTDIAEPIHTTVVTPLTPEPTTTVTPDTKETTPVPETTHPVINEPNDEPVESTMIDPQYDQSTTTTIDVSSLDPGPADIPVPEMEAPITETTIVTEVIEVEVPVSVNPTPTPTDNPDDIPQIQPQPEGVTPTIAVEKEVQNSHTYTYFYTIEEFGEYQVIEEEDPTLTPSESYVKQQGHLGKAKLIHRSELDQEGNLIWEEDTREVVVEPLPTIIVKGTKVEIVKTQEEVTRDISLDQSLPVIYQENDQLAQGQEVVIQGALPEIQRVTEIQHFENGVLVSTETTHVAIIQQAQPKIVQVGTQTTTYEEASETLTIPQPETIYQYNDQVPEGTKNEIQAGQEGQETVYYEITLVNGIETHREEIRREVTTEAKPTVIEIGTQTIAYEESSEIITIPQPETVYQYNDRLPQGNEHEIQAGQEGQEKIYYQLTIVNGSEIHREEIRREVTTEAKPTIIEVGTQTPSTFNTYNDYAIGETIRVGNPTTPGVTDATVISYNNKGDVDPNLVMQLPDEEVYRRALDDEHYNNNILLDVHGQLWDYNRILSDEMVAKINDGTYFDHQKAQQYMYELVNQARRDAGLHEYTYAHNLQQGVDARSTEQAINGDIIFRQVDGTLEGHVRDDQGTLFTMAYRYLPHSERGMFGENSALIFTSGNLYQAMSEKYIVDILFDSWMKSPAHRDEIMSEVNTEFALSIRVSNYVKDFNTNDLNKPANTWCANMVTNIPFSKLLP